MLNTQLSDDEVLATFRTHQPVTSEKNIWAYWDTGIDNVKPWCLRNIISWARRHQDDGWTVRIVDAAEGSPNHYSHFIPPTTEYLPQAFLDQNLTGGFKRIHTSDMIRTALLLLHGGVWMDVGFMLFRNLDGWFWDILTEEGGEKEVFGLHCPMRENASMMWNTIVGARKGSRLIRYWHQTYINFFAVKSQATGFHEDPLVQHLPSYEEVLDNPVFDHAVHVDYLIHMYALERVRSMHDPSRDWIGDEYFKKHVYMTDSLTEVYWFQQLTGRDGRKQFDILSRQREGVPHDEKWQEAEDLINESLEKSSALKFGHGIARLDGVEYLATIWDQPENKDADIKEGTFAARLRWASLHHNRTEHAEELKPVIRPDGVLVGDLYTAVGKPHPEIYPNGR